MRVADGGSTARPANWWILGLSADPTPGDPFTASLLSSEMSGVADGAYESRRGVQSLMGDPAITGWAGASGDAFRAACEPFPGQLTTMYDSYQGAADALTAFNTAASDAQGTADGAYYSAHSAAGQVGLGDDDFHSVAGSEGWGYSHAVRQVLLTKQKAAQGPQPPQQPPHLMPVMAGGILGPKPDPDQLQGPYQSVLDSMVQAQNSALNAKDAYNAAVLRCVDALEKACSAQVIGASWSGANGGTFDQRYLTFGGSPSQLHFNGAGFEGAEAAADAAAWQRAKQNPNDPANQKIIDDIKASLAAHQNDPEYLTGFADATPEDVTAFQGLPAVDANALNMTKLAEDVQQPNCPQSLKDLYKHLTDPHDTLHEDNMFLLGFDAKGKGHAAVSYGNPDTAANTAVYVPGTTSTLAAAGGDLSRAQALYDAAPGKMASVYWLGYDAPDWPPPLGHDPALGPANQKYADAGGPLLAHFVNSLNSQHQGPTNVTMIGHSYGSTVVGDALANYGLHAQGAIFVGSPGVIANTAAGLHLDPSRVWASKMEFDPVPSASATLDPLEWGDDHSLRFGNDPTSSAFGGQTFNSDDGSDITNAHSNYWDPHGPGLGNMSHIVLGQTNGIPPMTQDAKQGSLNLFNPMNLAGSALQNAGHAMGDWGAPIEHVGDAAQSFGDFENAPVGALGDLASGDVSGAGHQIADMPGEAWNGVQDLGKSVGDLFSW
jgi:uncharacterized protein YukE